ncbi:MAG TPA: hypothetical protein VGP48_12435 [Stellaceae bacterium]|jgi:hypothetical protein|nr:hypothetical protein [Stellaceae bacterium]
MAASASKLPLLFATILAASIAAPFAASFADPVAPPLPNPVNNATVDRTMGADPSTGIYDTYDKYRDPQGYPQPGWQYLTLPPS